MNILSLKDFIKKYSTLSNDFIDDFYTIYDFNEYNNNDLIINIDIVAKWLNSKKGKIKETLVNSYHINIDYKISKQIQNKKISKSNKEIILLTPDSFKRLCLLSKTKKGEEVRTYFIELEKLINNYTQENKLHM
jgi:phage anti-repressor protein